jgi:integrase
VTATALRALPDPDEDRAGSWSGVLRAAVGDEFAVEIYRPVPGDPVLFGPTCAVGGCPATGVNRSLGLNASGVNRSVGTRFRGYLCLSHVRIWRRAGSPPIDGWVRDAALTARGLAMPAACKIPACRRSARSNGFCTAHMKHWTVAGRPEDLDAFAASAPVVVVREQRCAVPACRFPSAGKDGLCDCHTQRYFNARYRRLGLTVAGYLQRLDDARAICAPKFDMRDLPAVVQLELQYALQCRQQAARAAMGPLIFGTVVRWLRDVGVESVLERSETFWVQDSWERFRSSTRANPMAWLRYVRHSALTLRDNHEGLEIWDFDTWPVDRLDVDGRYAHQPGRRIYFAEIDPLWLRELVKRWARWRITTATKSPASISCSTSSIRRFCRFAEEHGVALTGPAAITRALLERYLIAVRQLDRSVGRQSSLVTDLKVFLDDVRLHDWAPGLPPNATYFKGEVPRSRNHLPRFIDEFVMGQISEDATIARLPDLTTQTAVVILIETGLRSIDTLRLPFDPITVDEAGAPYLIFYNHKLSRDAIIPISQRLVAQIRRQQHDLDERFGAPRPPYLLPAIRANAGGKRPLTWGTLSRRLDRWMSDCDIRDATGQPARVTMHQFRHTLGTRMINNDVSLPAIQRMLDHDSPEMTLRYARIKDQTLRREWEAYQQRINIQGEVICLDPDGPLSDAAWALENLARAKQTLPNGYCGLPLQQTCPHPNACLTCDNFLTTLEFLPAHRDQLARTEQLIQSARASGAQRLVEINEPVRINLIRIIEGLDALPAFPEPGQPDA